MALQIRKRMLDLRNINNYYYRLFTAAQSSRHRSWRSSNSIIQCFGTQTYFVNRWLHTSNVLSKVVAFKLSDIGEGIREVVIKEWFIKVGDRVQQFDNICEVQSDKAAVTITSRYDGVVKRLHHQVDDTALVGEPLVDIETESADNEVAAGRNTEVPEKAVQNVENNSLQKVKVLTTPAVRRIASQFKVDLGAVNATGRDGRILKEDVLSYLNITADMSNDVPSVATARSASTANAAASVEARSIPIVEAKARAVVLEDRVVPVTGFTKAMVKSMTEAMKIPHFGFSDEYDVTKLVELRETLKVVAQQRGIKLTYMPIIIKAASLGLTLHPIINSSLDSSCENIIYKSSHNIGVAMDTPNGLVVPVIKNVQTKSIFEIARELNMLQEKGSSGQLGLSDISDGTFTLSNIGIVGGTYTKPVILPPQVSIGALGKIQVLPRFDANGNLVKAHVITVSWSADHRVVDGVTMAKYSNELKQFIENPYKLLLDL